MIKVIKILLFILITLFPKENMTIQMHYIDIDESIDYKIYTSDFEALYNDSTLIIKAQKVNFEENDSSVIVDESMTKEHTLSKVKIMNIYKSSSDYSTDEFINILEPFRIKKLENEVQVYCLAGYREMLESKDYILFLKKQYSENSVVYYGIVGMYQGKFPSSLITNEHSTQYDIAELEVSEIKKNTYVMLLRAVKKGLAEMDLLND